MLVCCSKNKLGITNQDFNFTRLVCNCKQQSFELPLFWKLRAWDFLQSQNFSSHAQWTGCFFNLNVHSQFKTHILALCLSPPLGHPEFMDSLGSVLCFFYRVTRVGYVQFLPLLHLVVFQKLGPLCLHCQCYYQFVPLLLDWLILPLH